MSIKSTYNWLLVLIGLFREIYSDPDLEGWFTWKVLFPLVIMVSLWPSYRLFFHDDYSFVRAFAHGDLLIFSGLIVIESAMETKNTKRRSRELPKALGAMCFFAFGLVKYHAIQQEQFMKAGPSHAQFFTARELLAPCFFVCAVTFLSLVFTVYTVSEVIRSKEVQAYDKMASGPIEQGQETLYGK